MKLKKEVDRRVDELKEALIKAFADRKITNYYEFKDPGMQFALVETLKGYATYGDSDKLSVLTNLLIDRMQSRENNVLKCTIDNAIKVINSLSKEHLDFIALLFFVKHCHYKSLENDLDGVVNHFNNIAEMFSVSRNDLFPYLNSIGCLNLYLDDAYSHIAKAFRVDRETILHKLNECYKCVPSDWGLSYIGIAIAITYINTKIERKLDYNIWIK